MDLIKRAEALGFEIRLQQRSTVWLKYPTTKDAYAVYTFNTLWEFEAFLDGFALGKRSKDDS